MTMSKQNHSKILNEMSPTMELLQMVTGYRISQTIYVAAKLGIADALKDGPKSCDALARSTGTHTQSLCRLMCALASVGVFAEVEKGFFALTPLAVPLQTDAPDSVRSVAITFGEEWFWRPWGKLLHSIRTGENAFEHVFGTGIFEYFTQNAEASAIFNQCMTELTRRNAAAILTAYDFSRITKLVDVGGGNGTLIASILKENPQMHGLLFDLPPVIERAKRSMEMEDIADRCEFIGGDFFESVPAGADAYILKWIIHDFEDDQAVTILKNCRRGMAKDGRLLLVERILLPGNAPDPGKLSDITMMVLPGGRERTEAEFRELFDAAGFRLTRIIPTELENSIIEGQPV